MGNFIKKKSLTFLMWVLLLVQLVVVVSVAGQKWRTDPAAVSKMLDGYLADEQRAATSQQDNSSEGEQVDKLASATGDQFWQPQQQQDWYQQALLRIQQQDQLAEALADLDASHGQYQPFVGQLDNKKPFGFSAAMLAGPTSGLRNYRALIDEFKHLSPISNPTRESRAFKPKLMSTARGFGKRAFPAASVNSAQHASYTNMFASANPDGLAALKGKMSNNALR